MNATAFRLLLSAFNLLFVRPFLGAVREGDEEGEGSAYSSYDGVGEDAADEGSDAGTE